MAARHPELQMADLDAERADEFKREALRLLRERPDLSRTDLAGEVYFWVDATEREAAGVDRIAREVWDEAQPDLMPITLEPARHSHTGGGMLCDAVRDAWRLEAADYSIDAPAYIPSGSLSAGFVAHWSAAPYQYVSASVAREAT